MNGITWERIPGGALITNVPHYVAHHAADGGFGIQYAGSGPADFALNILEHFLIRRGYEGSRVKVFKGDVFRLAWERHQSFKEQFLVNAPDIGAIDFTQIAEFLVGASMPGRAE